MTDLLQILPSFPISSFATLIPALEAHALSTSDLLTLHPTDLAKQTHLPILDLRRLLAAIQASLSGELISKRSVTRPSPCPSPTAPIAPSPGSATAEEAHRETHAPDRISTLDDGLDAALGGGIPTGRITEFVGESGAGKTQFLLSLCLAVQLPPPRGLGRQALYISTESGLATRRLAQMIDAHPVLAADADADADANRVSLDNILSTITPDLESQDHILEYQVPVLLSSRSIGLLVLDSVAANYRAEFERRGSMGSNMAARTAELVRLGALLRGFARAHNLAVVVANQVADRFPSPSDRPASFLRGAGSQQHTLAALSAPALPESPLASRSVAPPPPPLPSSAHHPASSASNPFAAPEQELETSHPALLLDHQQRWFTGWGDHAESQVALKTPSLGLVWSTQISCRVALLKRPAYGRPRRLGAPREADVPGALAEDGRNVSTLRTWRRWMKVVFAPHVKASEQGIEDAVEYDITAAGLKSIQRD
ncbi:DNA repair protein rhp57 [Escovopsis weberi]|uniref:DNA repair protein rhp57 n=1 Tax=Escovopsis weberi TaxID=150374 RepID=A0A0M8N959_ESCWE|nr:DNA repair protein rhp57 [Escovopsis weberi]